MAQGRGLLNEQGLLQFFECQRLADTAGTEEKQCQDLHQYAKNEVVFQKKSLNFPSWSSPALLYVHKNTASLAL
jgi:hypothetical protein